jgi:Na+-translocating ferredoxin:NAD+ oxidoreductase RnfE subunit
MQSCVDDSMLLEVNAKVEPTVATTATTLIQGASQPQWASAAIGAVGIPYLALLALTVLEGRGGWETFARKILELGIDTCVLGLGVTGALFASDRIAERLGQGATSAAIAMVLIDLILTGFALHLRSEPPIWSEKMRAAMSIFLGFLILAINCGIVFRYS